MFGDGSGEVEGRIQTIHTHIRCIKHLQYHTKDAIILIPFIIYFGILESSSFQKGN